MIFVSRQRSIRESWQQCEEIDVRKILSRHLEIMGDILSLVYKSLHYFQIIFARK